MGAAVYGCAMVGAKLVFPGPKMGDPETLQSLIEQEQVTFAAGVPTVWQGMIAYLEKTGKRDRQPEARPVRRLGSAASR